MRGTLVPLRTLAGAASAVVPCAIGVHLVSEALALGAAAFSPVFWLRHVYLLVPLVLAAWSFAHTVGLGRTRSEMIRRCALVRAGMRAAGGGSTIVAFTAANLAFFAITQVLEGVPIASASIGVGLMAAVIGSLISALIVFFWGRSIVAIALAAVRAIVRCAQALAVPRYVALPAPRSAGAAFSLFIPNRPPPSSSPA